MKSVLVCFGAVAFLSTSAFAFADVPTACVFTEKAPPQLNITNIKIAWGAFVDNEGGSFWDKKRKAKVWLSNEASQSAESYDVVFDLSKTTTRCVYQERASGQINESLKLAFAWNSYDACEWTPGLIKDYGLLSVVNADQSEVQYSLQCGTL